MLEYLRKRKGENMNRRNFMKAAALAPFTEETS